MPSAEFDLVSHWQADGAIEDVFAVLTDVRSLPVWWPEVYLEVDVIEDGDARGVGRSAQLVTKGYLPYRLRWTLTTTEVSKPASLSVSAVGDLNGTGRWTLVQDGALTRLRYDWRVRLGEGWMRTTAPLLKPVFAWNHRWAMSKGEAGLRRALAQRAKPRAAAPVSSE